MSNKKIAIVTGSSGQLGKYFVNILLDNDFQVIGIDKNDNININNNMYIHKKLDITSESEVENFFNKIERVDVLINNAGIGVFTDFFKRTASEFKDVVNVNMLGTFLMSRASLRLMINEKNGKIINIASIYGVKSSDPRIYGDSGRNNSEVYSMSKAGVIMLTQYLTAHFSKYNIQVNSLSPGGVYNNQSNDFCKNYINKTPSERLARVEDFKPAIEFLISDENTYTSGQNIIIDGGFCSW